MAVAVVNVYGQVDLSLLDASSVIEEYEQLFVFPSGFRLSVLYQGEREDLITELESLSGVESVSCDTGFYDNLPNPMFVGGAYRKAVDETSVDFFGGEY